jgi:hypothetical protein
VQVGVVLAGPLEQSVLSQHTWHPAPPQHFNPSWQSAISSQGASTAPRPVWQVPPAQTFEQQSPLAPHPWPTSFSQTPPQST